MSGLGVLSSQNSTSSEECPGAQKRKLPEVGEMRKKMKKNGGRKNRKNRAAGETRSERDVRKSRKQRAWCQHVHDI